MLQNLVRLDLHSLYHHAFYDEYSINQVLLSSFKLLKNYYMSEKYSHSINSTRRNMKLIWAGNCYYRFIIHDWIKPVKMFESNCLNGRHEFLMKLKRMKI